MTSSPIISLIFVNYHSVWQLSLALKSLFLYEKDHSLYEVIVVNNDPDEVKALEVLQRALPFSLIHNSRNEGFAMAANVGGSAARGQFLGFINPDTLWCKEVLRKIAEAFLFKKELGIFGMTLVNEKGQYEKWSSGRFPSLKKLIVNNLTPTFLQQHDEDVFVEWVSGGGLFTREILFKKVHGFDEKFFLYFEDVDLCLRIKKLGYKIEHEPHIPLIHTGGKSSSSRSLQKKYFYASQKKYFRKHRPLYESRILNLFHFFLH